MRGKAAGWPRVELRVNSLSAMRFFCLLLPALAALGCLHAQDEYEEEPIAYSASRPKDAVQALQRQIEGGELKLDRRQPWSVLLGLLQALDIPLESQVMVFSKTSKQNDRIGPQSPRVVYFGMDAYVGYAVGGSIEVSCIDPKLGPIF